MRSCCATKRCLIRESDQRGLRRRLRVPFVAITLAMLIPPFLVVAVLTHAVAFSQTHWPYRSSEKNPVAVDFVRLYKDHDPLATLLVQFRVASEFAILTKVNESAGTSMQPMYHGAVEFAVELLRGDESVGRVFKIRDIVSASSSLRSPLIQYMLLRVPPDIYHVALEVRDTESSRRFVDDVDTLRLLPPSEGECMVYDFVPSIMRENADTTPEFSPPPMGGGFPLGQRCYFLVPLRLASGASLDSAHMELRRTIPSTALAIGRPIHSRVPATALSPASEIVMTVSDSTVAYGIEHASDSREAVLTLPIHADTLLPGNYLLTLHLGCRGIRTDSVVRAFSIDWDRMPRALSKSDIAIEAMKYIMDTNSYEELKSASEDSASVLFEDFWAGKDPTPSTSYNEALNEYYTRVDTAMEKFSTIRTPNGMKTDRGKAYILYGPPSRMERRLIPGEDPEEIWEYGFLRQRLIFKDVRRSGEFYLVHIDEIGVNDKEDEKQ